MALVAELLGAAVEDEFHQNLFGRQPAHWHSSSPLVDRLASLFAPDQLAALIPRAHSAFRWHRGDNGFEIEQIPASAALALYQSGRGLLFKLSPNELPELGGLFELGQGSCARLHLPADRFSLGIFVSTPGGHTPPHFDNSDTLTLQLHGHKRWALAPNTSVTLPPTNYLVGDPISPSLHPCLRGPLPEQMPADARHEALRPGSVLYTPRGLWHATWADSPAISLDLHFASVPYWADQISHAVRSLLLESPAARCSVTSGPEAASQLNTALDHLRRRLASVDAGSFLPPASPQPGPGPLRWNPLSTFVLLRLDPDSIGLEVRASPLSDESFRFSLSAAWLPLLDALKAGATTCSDELGRWGLAPRESAVLRLLWREGVLLAALARSAQAPLW